MLDLDPIRERLAAATPGPWEPVGSYVRTPTAEGRGGLEVCHVAPWLQNQTADADLIAHARTDLELLLAEVERLRGVATNLGILTALLDGDPAR